MPQVIWEYIVYAVILLLLIAKYLISRRSARRILEQKGLELFSRSLNLNNTNAVNELEKYAGFDATMLTQLPIFFKGRGHILRDVFLSRQGKIKLLNFTYGGEAIDGVDYVQTVTAFPLVAKGIPYFDIHPKFARAEQVELHSDERVDMSSYKRFSELYILNSCEPETISTMVTSEFVQQCVEMFPICVEAFDTHVLVYQDHCDLSGGMLQRELLKRGKLYKLLLEGINARNISKWS